MSQDERKGEKEIGSKMCCLAGFRDISGSSVAGMLISKSVGRSILGVLTQLYE